MRRLKQVGLTVLTLFLFGCATSSPTGAPFTRLSNDQFEIGKTTRFEIQAIMGRPVGESKNVTNGKTVYAVHYNYATRSQRNLFLVRAQSFFFCENVLVGQLYTSNLEQDATNFDDAQVESIQKGKTKIDEVFKKLGPPSGESIYPLTGGEDERKVMYFYPKKRADSVLYTKGVFVLYKSNGLVSDLVFSENFPV